MASPPHRPAAPATTQPGRVVIAGVGLVTPLGVGAWASFASLLAGRRITDRIAQLEPDTDAVPLVQAVGGVSVARHTATDPAVELAERAAREAVGEAGTSLNRLPTWLGTSKGAVGKWGEAAARRQLPHAPALTVDHALAGALGPHGYLTHHLQLRTGLQPRGHCVAACASGLTALHHARMALQHDSFVKSFLPATAGNADPEQGDEALVLTAEAALLPPFIHSYRRLGVLAPLTLEGYRGRPLAADRGGFVLAEVGAAVLLRRLPPGQAPTPGQVELLDTALATEAEDLIRPSAEMAALSRVAGRLIGDRPIGALHPHAPGTAEHDPRELAILAQALQRQPNPTPGPAPAVYAHKGALGHTLGSAGLVSLVLACLSARTGQLPPMPWLNDASTTPPAGPGHVDTPLPVSARPALDPDRRHAAHVILAAGFAGHVAGAAIAPVA